MDFKNIPKICIGECYICLEKMYFEDYCKKKDKSDQMHETCGIVLHQICTGCFLKLKTNKCPMCKRRLINTPPALQYELDCQEMLESFRSLMIIQNLIESEIRVRNTGYLIFSFDDEDD